MPGPDFTRRNALVAAFRRRVLAANHTYLLAHQAEVCLASEGWTLEPQPPQPGQHYIDVFLPLASCPSDAMVVGTREVRGIPCVIVRRLILPRGPDSGTGTGTDPSGAGVAAHILADLAAFKGGKSWFAALWMSGFAVLPDGRVDIIGAEYSICEPEFTYVVDMLCSEAGMNMKYSILQQDTNHGRMRLKLRSGAEFTCRSWERKENLKGKKRHAYVYAEAYQLPGMEVYTSLSQNLRELDGFALFPTTPDRPWVGTFHDHGHGQDLYWHCTCCIDAKENPFTFDQRARDRDDPALDGIMTREKFAIAWCGQLGRFIGRVYDYNRGDPAYVFTPESHSGLWRVPGQSDLVMQHGMVSTSTSTSTAVSTDAHP